MKRKTLIWTVTGLGLLAGAALAMNRYSAIAQGPNIQFSGTPVASQPTTTPYSVPPMTGPASWNGPNAPQVIRYDRAIAPNAVNTFATAPVYASPGAHQDEMRVQQLLKEYQSSKEEAKRKELVEQITKTVAHQFEEKQLIRERELKELEERVKELRTTHAKRESLKDKIIADRVQQLINNVDGMGWGYEPSNVMIPAAGSPLLLPPGQYTTPPGYVPVPINTFPGQPMLPGQPSIPGQATSRAPRAYSPGTGDLGALPSSVPALSTTAAPAALLPTEATAPSTIEPADLSEPNTTPVAAPIDPNKEPAR